MNFLAIPEWILVTQGVVSILQMVAQGVQLGMMIHLMNKITDGAWLLEQARKWGIYFDKILIEYANTIYNYFVQILEGNLFTPSVIEGIMSRMYILVGLFIFFKLAALAIKYIVAPEQFLDEKVGGQQLIKRMLIGSILIVMMPLIFDIGIGIQSAVISDNILGKMLLPEEIYNYVQRDKDNVGKNLGMMIISGFFGWNETIDKDLEKNLWGKYERVVTYNDISLFNDDDINKQVNGQYVFSYVPIISTLAVGYYLLTLVKYSLEVLLRMIKLSFLQIIAPFSIVKYMLNPADDESLKKWINTTVSTYIIIFVRVLTLWFMAMMAYYLKNGIPTDGEVVSLITNDTDEVLKALIVIAMFAFLKDLPKLLSDLFGYNLQENETINGVLNQATGALKGLALGKVGMQMQKPMMYTGMAAQGLGAVSSGLGAAGKAYEKTGKVGFSTVAQGISTGGLQGLGSFTSSIGGVVSSNMGGTAIGALTKGTGSVAQTSNATDFRDDFDVDKSKDIDASIKQNSNLTKNDQNNIQLTSQNDVDQLIEGISKTLEQKGFDPQDLKAADGSSVITREKVEEIMRREDINPTNITSAQSSTIYRECQSVVEGVRDARLHVESDQAVSRVFSNESSRTDIRLEQPEVPSDRVTVEPLRPEPHPAAVQPEIDISRGMEPPRNNNNGGGQQ